MMIATAELKEYTFSKEVFGDLPTQDYDALKNDISKHGIKVALHILPNHTVICGHQRLRVAKELGLKTVPCEIKELKSDLETREWSIKDNLLRRQLTDTQRYLLYAKLSEIYEVGQIRTETGRFARREDTVSYRGNNVLERTAKEVGENPKTIQRARAYARAIKEMPDLKTIDSPISVINEYQRRKEVEQRKTLVAGSTPINNLVLGDCIEKIPTIPNESVDMLLIDPPYGNVESGGGGRIPDQVVKGENWSYQLQKTEIFETLESLFGIVNPKLKKDAHIYIFTNWQNWAKLESVVKKHFQVKNCLVYHYGVSVMCHGDTNYSRSYGMILFASKEERRRLNCVSPSNFIQVNRPRLNNHPAEKSTEILKILIKNSTVEKELVLDCFAGSGSTLVAAEELGRNWIGIEIDKQWYDVARARIHELRNKKEPNA